MTASSSTTANACEVLAAPTRILEIELSRCTVLVMVVLLLTGNVIFPAQPSCALCDVPSIEFVPCWSCEAEVRAEWIVKLEPWGKASHIWTEECAQKEPVSMCTNLHTGYPECRVLFIRGLVRKTPTPDIPI